MNKLPKKWCIKVNEENRTALGKWRDSGALNFYTNGYIHTPLHGHNGYYKKTRAKEFKEITFKDFKRFILGEISDLYEIY